MRSASSDRQPLFSLRRRPNGACGSAGGRMTALDDWNHFNFFGLPPVKENKKRDRKLTKKGKSTVPKKALGSPEQA
jgi:hypothetical protein